MKRPITNLVIGLLALFASHLAAQPTFTVSPQTVTGNVGDVVTVNILVDNFTDIISFQYTMNWNASVLQFQQPVGNVNPSQLAGMTSGSFGLTLASTGKITVSWSDLNAMGVTLSNGTLIYSLNFLVLSANTTTIGFSDTPVPKEVIKAPSIDLTNTSTFLPASFSGGGGNGGGGGGGGGGNNPPVNGFAIIGSDETAATGDQICIDVTVNDFTDIQSVQYTMEFDETKWQFDEIPTSSYGLPGLASGSFGLLQTGQGYINFSWSDTGGGAVTLADGTVIYQVCLNAIGSDNCGSTTEFEFNSEAVPVEVIDINNQTVPFQGISGDLEICGNGGGGGGGGGNNPPVNGFAIIGSDETGEVGEQICVDVTVNDFIDIQSVQYTMEFDETKWQFDEIPMSSYGLPGLAAGSFGTTQVGQGYINFSWSDTGGGAVTLADGTVIYQVCLNAIGANNCNSTTPFEFNSEAVPVEVIDINNQTVAFQGIPGDLEICDDPNGGGGGGGGGGNYTGLTFVAGEVEAPTSTQICVDYKVYNFDCVTSAQFTIHFNQTITQYLGVQGFGLPELTAANFGTTQTANGTLNFSWPSPDPANGTSIPDGTTIFQVCFNVIGTNGQVSNLTFDGNPTIVEAGSCNNSNEPISFDPGSVTVGVSCTGPVTIASNTITQVACAGQSTGGVAITTAGGSAVKTYEWKNSSGTTVSTSQNLTGVPAGVYSVTVTSCGGTQTTTSQFTITQPTPLNINFTATDVACFGETNGAVDISVTGGTTTGTGCMGYSYIWSNGATTQDITGLPIGNYKVTVTDCNGCTAASPTYIISGATSAMTVAISVNNVSCFGGNNGSITINVTGGGQNKQYRLGGNWQTLNVFSNLNAGTYTVQIRDEFGCVKSESVTITEPAIIVITTTATNPSPGQNNGSITTTVTGGVPPYTYSWSGPNGSITPSPGANPTNLQAGTYCVTVSDAHNCSKQKCQLVSAPITDNPLNPTIAKNSCAGSPCNGSISVNVIGGIAPYTYAWTSNNGTTPPPLPIITGLCPGIYSVTVTSPTSGQSWTQTFTITQPANPPQAFPNSVPPTTSASCNGSIELAVSGGEGAPYTFQWSGTPQTGNPVFALCEGSYSVTITDENGCTGTGGPYVVDYVPPVLFPPQASASKSCSAPQNTGKISLSITGGIPPYNYQITNGTISQSLFSAQGVVFEDLPAGTYTYTITDNGSGVDQQDATGTITVGETVLSLSSVQITHATSATQFGSIYIEPAGGALPYSFSWNNGLSSEDIPNAQPFCYELTLIDANGCVQSFDDLGVGLLSATADFDRPNCPQELGSITANVTLTPSCANQNLPYTYDWTNSSGVGVGSAQTINNVIPDVYTVVITDAAGTSFTQEFELESLSNLSVSAEVTTDFNGFGVLCHGSTNGKAKAFASDGQPPYTYEWSNGSNTQEATGLNEGNHIVTISDGEGCEMTASVNISEPTPIITQTTASSSGCTGGPTGQATVIVTGGVSGPNCYSYNWNNGGTTATISNLEPGTYLVTVTDCNGCTKAANVEVQTGSELVVQAVSVPDSGGPNGVAGVEVTGGTWPYEFYWQDFPSIADSLVTELFPGDYLVLVTDANDCQKALVVNVGDETLCGQVRTVITPEGDGKNEEFIIECLSRFNDNTLEIFNRWGQLVYSVEDYNDSDLWRGTTSKGDDVPDGVYYYVFNYFDPGTNAFVTKKGSVTVLRK